MTIVTDVESARDALESFRADRRDTNKSNARAATDLSVTKQEDLYRLLQEAYGIGLALRDKANESVLWELLHEHFPHLAKQKSSKNPWMPVTNLMFGKWTGKGKKLSFTADLSAKKYAPVFLYMDSENVPEDEASDYISSFHNGNFGKKLLGLEAAGRALNGPEDDDELNQEFAKLFIDKGMPAGAVERDVLVGRARDHRDIGGPWFVSLWGIVAGDKVLVYGALPKSGDRSAKMAAVRASRDVKDYVEKYRLASDESRTELRKPATVASVVWEPIRDARIEQVQAEVEEKRLAQAAIVGGEKHPQNAPEKPRQPKPPRKPPKVFYVDPKGAVKKPENSTARRSMAAASNKEATSGKPAA